MFWSKKKSIVQYRESQNGFGYIQRLCTDWYGQYPKKCSLLEAYLLKLFINKLTNWSLTNVSQLILLVLVFVFFRNIYQFFLELSYQRDHNWISNQNLFEHEFCRAKPEVLPMFVLNVFFYLQSNCTFH